jgi:hypothetical protein
MANSTKGPFSTYFPAQVTVSYNPKEISTFYINYFAIHRIFNSLPCLHCLQYIIYI